MSELYREEHRRLQRQFNSERIADRIEERLVQSELDDSDKAFIESQLMFFLATADVDGRPNCSFKGGAPGFVRVLDPHTLAFPDYNGNGMYLSLGNALANPHVGLLFIDFQKQSRIRVNGLATIRSDDPLMADYPGAKLMVRVHVDHAFPNCSRYIPKMTIEEPSRFVPKPNCVVPVPDWKRSDWARDVLPLDDPANQ